MHAPSQPFSTANYLHTPDDVAAYLDAALEDGHPDVMLLALRQAVAAAGGMTQLAGETGRSREHLYRVLSEQGNPRLDTLLAVLKALNLRLSVTVKHEEAA